jgi:hypothetical protein
VDFDTLFVGFLHVVVFGHLTEVGCHRELSGFNADKTGPFSFLGEKTLVVLEITYSEGCTHNYKAEWESLKHSTLPFLIGLFCPGLSDSGEETNQNIGV